MGRKALMKDSVVVSVRFDIDEYKRMQDIAALESINSGQCIPVVQLIRQAVHFTYSDNEKLREVFRRNRNPYTRKFKRP